MENNSCNKDNLTLNVFRTESNSSSFINCSSKQETVSL